MLDYVMEFLVAAGVQVGGERGGGREKGREERRVDERGWMVVVDGCGVDGACVLCLPRSPLSIF
jgi:hypothetical protein